MIKWLFLLVFNLLFSFLTPSQASGRLNLTVRTDKISFQLGEPVLVNVELKNVGSEPENIIKYLTPDYKFTTYTITNPDDEQKIYSPLTILNVRHNLIGTLSPGSSLFKTAKVFFGNKGWLFDKPGRYKIKATHTSLDGNHIHSNESSVEIRSPVDESNRRAAKLMLTSETGILLLWEGGDQFAKGIVALQTVAEQLPETIHAIYANFTLGMNLSIDQGERKADLDKATKYLEKARRLSKGKMASDYIRSKTLLKLYEIYVKTGKGTQQNEIRRVFLKEFKDKKQFEKALKKIEREMPNL